MPPFQSEAAPLERYGYNLTELAKHGAFAPFADQDITAKNLLQILQRKHKSNPVLLDGDEIRRWKVVAEAVRRMAVGDAPDPLLKRQVIALDYEALLAEPPEGMRGFVEVRLQAIFAAMQQAAGSVVLFIDHFQRLLGGEESGINASNLLAPLLNRREIQLIGTCTLEQYRQNIEHNASIQRCCQPFFTPEAEQEYWTLLPRRREGDLHGN